ncbi:MAG: thioredoxin [Planctomycetota bacterium]
MSSLIHVDDNNFVSEVKNFNGVAVVDFSAEWCSPCRFLSPIIDKLAAEYAGNDSVKFVKVDVDEARQTAISFGIRAVPTVIYFKDGTEVHRSMGVQPADSIKSKVDSLLK